MESFGENAKCYANETLPEQNTQNVIVCLHLGIHVFIIMVSFFAHCMKMLKKKYRPFDATVHLNSVQYNFLMNTEPT